MADIVIPASGGQGRFRVGFLEKAREDGRKFLTDVQYAYVVDVLKRLADWGDPQAVTDLRIEQVEDFWELKLKGNVLGKINTRVFFAVFQQHRLIVVLGSYKKEQEGALPRQIVIRVRSRHRIARQLVDALTRPGVERRQRGE